MNHRPAILLTASLIAVALFGCTSSDKPKEAATTTGTPLTVKDSVEVSVTAKVKAIDQASRTMTLQDNIGHQVTFVVDESVKRLNEVMVGDEVRARYKATLVAELRPPTAEEAATPIAVVEGAGRSPQGAAPAAGVAQAVRVVTTVEAVDVPGMRVTLRGPMGALASVYGRNPENIKKLRVGDSIVITYTASVAIALEKVAPRG